MQYEHSVIDLLLSFVVCLGQLNIIKEKHKIGETKMKLFHVLVLTLFVFCIGGCFSQKYEKVLERKGVEPKRSAAFQAGYKKGIEDAKRANAEIDKAREREDRSFNNR